jgi:hypothetical protein
MKYVLAIVLTALVVGTGVVAYFKGWLPTVSFNKPQAVSTAVPEESLPTVAPTTPQASAAAEFTQVTAGGVLVFNKYTIDIPKTWTYTKEVAPTGEVALDKLIISKGIYKISIFQAATGGAPCLYPGDAAVEGPSSTYTTFVNLVTGTGDKLRRSGTENPKAFTVCEFQSGGYGQPTTFGHISIETGLNPPKSLLDEIDAMLTSLKKV